MLERFLPDMFVDGILDIDLEMLKKNSIKGLILDIGNTLVPPKMKEADENAVEWIDKVKKVGLKVCIVSNNSKKRVIKFNERLKVFAIYKAYKPSKKALRQAAMLMNIKESETAVIGDQIFTDVFGGNRLDMLTVLVKPIARNENIFIKFKRLCEKVILFRYKHKNSYYKHEKKE